MVSPGGGILQPPTPIIPIKFPLPAKPAPRFNEVFRKATHNSYWIPANNGPGIDPEASGTQERLTDQMLHEHVRAIELDVHFDANHDGEFTIYHTNTIENSVCHTLAECLQIMKRLDYVEPNHEGVMIVLEMKETVALQRVFGNGAVNQNHQFADLDRLLWEELGTRLYTPREFLSRCANKSDGTPADLVGCAKTAGWPTVDEMRGRYVVSIIGNWARNYFDWLDYANSGVQSRAAFPMRSMLSPDLDSLTYAGTVPPISTYTWRPEIEVSGASLKWNGNEPSLPFGDSTFQSRLLNARNQSVIWQLENERFMDPAQNIDGIDGRASLGDGILMRSHDAFTWQIAGNNPYGDQYRMVVNNWPTDTGALTAPLGCQFIQTDYPWSFISDVKTQVPGVAGTSQNDFRAFFQREDVAPGMGNSYPTAPASGQTSTTPFDPASLIEPGRRLYLEPTYNSASAAMKTNDGNDFWEFQATGSMNTHDENWALQGAPGGGDGCFTATSSTDASSQFTICRQADTDDRRTVHLKVSSTSAGSTQSQSFDMPHFDPEPTSIGDLVRVQVTHGPGASTVHVWTAGWIDPTNTPHWNELGGVSGRQIAANLDIQGISATESILFSGLRHGLALERMTPVALTDLPIQTQPTYIHDVSYCPGNACDVSHVPNRTQTVTSWDGGTYVKVYEMFGHVFGGQPRHFYTTDPYEATTSGLSEQVTEAKFLLRVDAPDASWIPVYRCVDLKKDVHAYWLSTNPACTNSGDSAGTVQDVLGYASSTPRSNMSLLTHGRLGTSNSTGWHNGIYNGDEHDTHDHRFTPTIQDLAGYDVRDDSPDPKPYVYTLAGGTTPPCQPVRTTCGAGHCIQQDDGCGRMIQCAACGTGQVCNDTSMLCVDANSKAGCEAACQDWLQCAPPMLRSSCVSQYHSCIAACDQPGCTPKTCASAGATCGTMADGCGGTLSCGTCGANSTCNGSNQCVCTPRTSCGTSCGPQPDGCGGTLQCAACKVCTPKCGTSPRCGASDGCGGKCDGSCGKVGYVCDGSMCVRGD